jgi:arginase
VHELDAAALPEGPLYLHVDVDVCDAGDVPGPLLFPTAGGPRLGEVVEAVRAVARTGRVVGVGLAATWRSDVLADGATGDVVRRLAAAASG